jgi:transposase
MAPACTEILNHHHTGACNGPAEGMHFCAKQVKRSGRGFTNFEHPTAL